MPLLTTLSSASARAFGGNLPLSANEAEELSGVSATASIGAVSAGAAVAAAVTGVSSTSFVGTSTVEVITPIVNVNVSGVSALGALGSAKGVSPPAVQYVVALRDYLVTSSPVTYFSTIEAYTYDPSTYALTYVSARNQNTYQSAAQYTTTAGTLTGVAAFTKPAGQRILVHPITGGGGRAFMIFFAPLGSENNSPWNTYVSSIYFDTSYAEPFRSANVTNTLMGSGGLSAINGMSIGNNGTVFATAMEWAGTGAPQYGARVFAYDPQYGQLGAQKSAVTTSGLSTRMASVAVHPTDDFIVWSTALSSLETRAYKNFGRTTFPLEEYTAYDFMPRTASTGTRAAVDMKWSSSGEYLAMLGLGNGASVFPRVVVIVRYEDGVLYPHQTIALPSNYISNTSLSDRAGTLSWGPSDSYILFAGDSNLSTGLLTIQHDGAGNFSLNEYEYPNIYQHGMPALNYDGSTLYGFTDQAIRVLLMEPGDTGLPATLVSYTPKSGLYYPACVSIPPLS